MNIQSGLIIALLAALVAFAAVAEFRKTPAATPSVDGATPAEFSVTPIAAGQYVMRANDQIYYCVANRCTGIQRVQVPANGAAGQPSAPAADDQESANP